MKVPDLRAERSTQQVGEPVEIVAEGDVTAEERLKLWVAAGARCAFCKRYLMENEETGDPVRIGEMAHIVGRTNKPGSPRGDDPLPAPERNKAENLILACPNDHTTVDNKTGARIWKTLDLRQLKREHEDAVRVLTAMTKERATTVIRVAGAVRRSTPSINKALVHEAVHAGLRYPQYRLGAIGSDVEIDLVTNLDEDADDYYRRTDEVLAHRVAQIGELVARGEVGHISVFALARIPVLVQLGHHLDDKWPVELVPFDRRSGKWGWTEAPAVGFSTVRTDDFHATDRLTLILSLSGTIDRDHLDPNLLRSSAVYEMAPVDAEPSVTLFRSRETLVRFADAYLAFLSVVEREHPNVGAIDVVPAIGTTAAIELGRRRTKSKHPPLRVWDQHTAGGDYFLATEVG